MTKTWLMPLMCEGEVMINNSNATYRCSDAGVSKAPAGGGGVQSKMSSCPLEKRTRSWGTGGGYTGTNRLRKHLCPSMVRTGLLVQMGTTLTSLEASEVGFREPSTHSPLMRRGGSLAALPASLLLPQLPLQPLLCLRPCHPC